MHRIHMECDAKRTKKKPTYSTYSVFLYTNLLGEGGLGKVKNRPACECTSCMLQHFTIYGRLYYMYVYTKAAQER